MLVQGEGGQRRAICSVWYFLRVLIEGFCFDNHANFGPSGLAGASVACVVKDHRDFFFF